MVNYATVYHGGTNVSEPAILVLEDGTVFHGLGIGISGQTVGEVVFNTAITGYQEILTDPSYTSQIVTLTYPHIGNTGINAQDNESDKLWVAGLIIRDLPTTYSNWRAQKSLTEYLKEQKAVAISNIDTRALTRLLREHGAQKGCIQSGKINIEQAKAAINDFPGLIGADLAQVVSTKKKYQWHKGLEGWADSTPSQVRKPFHVVAYDFGVKQNILRILTHLGCEITVVPAKTSAAEVLKLEPEGVFLSNGPGDPDACTYAIEATQTLLNQNIPVFGICLGHQILGLASGAKTIKMKFGHHGANHPVKELATNRVLITSQNHGFTIEEETMPANLKVTHRSLFDGTIQGIARTDKMAYSFQGHPEASPGPHEAMELFKPFIEMMVEQREKEKISA
jgi:carbamoyl-phosphate synthase small subunit